MGRQDGKGGRRRNRAPPVVGGRSPVRRVRRRHRDAGARRRSHGPPPGGIAEFLPPEAMQTTSRHTTCVREHPCGDPRLSRPARSTKALAWMPSSSGTAMPSGAQPSTGPILFRSAPADRSAPLSFGPSSNLSCTNTDSVSSMTRFLAHPEEPVSSQASPGPRCFSKWSPTREPVWTSPSDRRDRQSGFGPPSNIGAYAVEGVLSVRDARPEPLVHFL